MLRPTRDTRGAHREWPMPNSASERPSCHGGAPKPSGQRLDFHDVEATAQLTEGTGTGRFGSALRMPSKNPLGGHRGNNGVAVRARNMRVRRRPVTLTNCQLLCRSDSDQPSNWGTRAVFLDRSDHASHRRAAEGEGGN